MKMLVVIPTYNEAENISQLVPQIFANLNIDVLIADDNSPDGTGTVVKGLQDKYKQLHLLERPKKQGLGRAYVAAFKWGLEKNYDGMIEMDADFSHRVEDLRLISENLKSYDFVIGSRYVEGGATKNWGLLRKCVSRGGSFYSRMILGYPIRDWTGGFSGWTAQVLKAIDSDSIKSDGYSFQIELKYRAAKKGFRYLEVPILFEDRRTGQSKMSFEILLEALYKVWGMRLKTKLL